MMVPLSQFAKEHGTIRLRFEKLNGLSKYMEGDDAVRTLLLTVIPSSFTFLISWWLSGSMTLGSGLTAVQILATMVYLDLQEKRRQSDN
tara:strand:+ start:676 stop:942 length:267 start_codon:yes stop_codon:yes gene_type:complete